jgi:hypothetical protein
VSTPCRRSISTSALPPVILVIVSSSPGASSYSNL